MIWTTKTQMLEDNSNWRLTIGINVWEGNHCRLKYQKARAKLRNQKCYKVSKTNFLLSCHQEIRFWVDFPTPQASLPVIPKPQIKQTPETKIILQNLAIFRGLQLRPKQGLILRLKERLKWRLQLTLEMTPDLRSEPRPEEHQVPSASMEVSNITSKTEVHSASLDTTSKLVQPHPVKIMGKITALIWPFLAQHTKLEVCLAMIKTLEISQIKMGMICLLLEIMLKIMVRLNKIFFQFQLYNQNDLSFSKQSLFKDGSVKETLLFTVHAVCIFSTLFSHEAALYRCLLNHNLTWDCLLISVFYLNLTEFVWLELFWISKQNKFMITSCKNW